MPARGGSAFRRALAALGTLLLLGAVSSAPVLHRVDSNEVNQDDGPVLVTVRSSVFPDEANDHFSARLIPDGETGADWEPCTTASSGFCHYEAAGNGLRILRFATIDAAGRLEIRYAAGEGAPSEPIGIDVGSAPASDTLDAISKSFGGSPPPEKPRRVTLELRIDAAGGGHAAAPESEPKPQAQKPQDQKPPEARPQVAQAPAARPRPPAGPEFVHVTCSSVPLYADTHGTAIIAAGTVLVARSGDVFLAQRAPVSGRTGSLRVLDLGARVYIDAGCVR
jgi:hypothetical protein